ncbi:ribosomal protein S5-alanine N-acetyltransferase [Vibrio genomosp. F10]|uniref:ribosomal protein S5-alanine N-acetyltransferase n=1 Tax=Vibrio genomosp. F10 TaxID=723171 RepID=UPI000302327E|nr:ribosomal protein S5-alanine N-acetyltransferase [Vibrio genomosp. F10]OEF03911.1 ribosomal-protein-alanine acetyltransferase [Vibrio genomosp. F10 str. 9ZB36]
MNRVNSHRSVYEADDDFILRTAEIDDAQRITDYFNRNRTHLKSWEPKREDAFFTYQGWSKKLIKLHELHSLGLGFYLIILSPDSQTVLGTVSFSNLSRFPCYTCTVGYSLDGQLQGKGIMTRALNRAINYMFTYQSMHRINAAYMPKNERSAAVLKNNGFEKEGFAKKYLLINGQWEDHILTSCINENWKAVK